MAFKFHKKQTVFIAGGAGFIGSHVNKLLLEEGYSTVILDNFTRGDPRCVINGTLIKGDLADKNLLVQILAQYRPDAVMHFAAYTEVGESVLHPAKYYQNNLVNTLNLLDAMVDTGIKTFIFSSSAAVYGLPQQNSISEDHPTNPINPYGESKLIIERILSNYDRAYGLKYCCLRYFNAAGGDPDGKVKNYKKKEGNLIPIALKTLLNAETPLTIHGTDYPTFDGTCIRDYIHVHDLGKAHLAGMDKIQQEKQSCTYNLGNGNGFSVKQIIDSIEKITGKKLLINLGGRRAGDPPVLIANSGKAQKELAWSPIYPHIDTMIEHAWNAIERE